MNILDKLFGRNKNNNQTGKSEHAVIIRFLYGIDELEPLHRLEKKLEQCIAHEGVGEYDGYEIATDYHDGFLYMYGPDAGSLFRTIHPILKQTHFMKEAVARLRFGPPEDGVKEIEVRINE